MKWTPEEIAAARAEIAAAHEYATEAALEQKGPLGLEFRARRLRLLALARIGLDVVEGREETLERMARAMTARERAMSRDDFIKYRLHIADAARRALADTENP